VFTAGQGMVLMIDGKVATTNSYTYLLPLRPTAARFVDNSTFRFYGIKDNQIYRVTVTM
jgi:hypothetical protein